MKLKLDKISQNKNIDNSIDSSLTTDSISDFYNTDNTPLKNDIDKLNNNLNTNYNIKYGNNVFNPKTKNDKKYNNNNNNETISEDDIVVEKMGSESKFFLFKKNISLTLCFIYFFLFLISIPKRPMKSGEEKNINILLKANQTKNIHILVNNFQFPNTQNKNNNSNYELKGYLLEFKSDKIYIIRWFIGFIFFSIRNFCFVYSDFFDSNSKSNTKNKGGDDDDDSGKKKIKKKNDTYMFKDKVDILKKFSCLFFPLLMFFYDIKKNNISYVNIKNEYINDIMISYYIMTNKRFSLKDYVEGIIPTLSYFLISIIYKGMEQTISNFIRSNKKITKLV